MQQNLMKQTWRRAMMLMLTAMVMVVPVLVYADGGEPGGNPDQPGNDFPPAEVPINGSMTLLFALVAVLFAIWAIKKRSRRCIISL